MAKNTAKWYNQHMLVQDGNELVTAGFPVHFYDDFTGSKLNKIIANENTVAPWTEVAAGTPTSAALVVANAANGVAVMSLANTNEAEDATLYWGDQLSLNINQGLIFECRAAVSVLPDAAGGIILIGLASAHNTTADTIATNLWFRLEGNANILWESDDTATNDDDNDTGIDAVAETYHIFRIDCTVPTAPRFYIDGVDVTTTATQTTACAMAAATATTARVQPYIGVNKASGGSVGGLWVDYVRIWQNRS
jgi:hypothetical protein